MRHRERTDEYYTPQCIYDALVDFVKSRVHLDWDNIEIVRPFSPGGDYQKFEYSEKCVVIDNPPFSIEKSIVDWYNERGIKYVLFCGIDAFAEPATGWLVPHQAIVYENGLDVMTTFCSNMWNCVYTVWDIQDEIKPARPGYVIKRTNKVPDGYYTTATLRSYITREMTTKNPGVWRTHPETAFYSKIFYGKAMKLERIK